MEKKLTTKTEKESKKITSLRVATRKKLLAEKLSTQ